MAIVLNGSTRLNVSLPLGSRIGAHIRIKTTQVKGAGNPPLIMSKDNNASRGGFLLFMGATGVLSYEGWRTGGIQRFGVTGVIPINDGVPHDITLHWSSGSGNICGLFVDGIQEASFNNAGIMEDNATFSVGRNGDAFWQTFNGQVEDIACWSSANLPVLPLGSAQQLTAGFDPRTIRQIDLLTYVPGNDSLRDLMASRSMTVVAGSVTYAAPLRGGASRF